MYVKFSELKEAVLTKDERFKNYFDTFGFLVIQNVLNKKEFSEYLREYDRQYEIRSKEYAVWEMLLNRLGFRGEKRFGFKFIYHVFRTRSGMTFLPCFIEESEKFVQLFLSDKMQMIFKYFCGENWLYLGSDGSKFITTSFPWHRDWFTKIPIMKCNFYFNPLPFLGGKFLLIPGSNIESDVYTQLIQKAMSWPMQNKTPSGLNENNQLPKIRNPREIFGLKEFIINFFQLKRKKFSKHIFDVPHVALTIRNGDLVVFDHRALHCVQTNFPQFQRRLLTFLIGKNAYDFNDNHYTLRNYTREQLMTDLVDLVVNERNHIGCKPWGDELIKTPFVDTTHFIHIEKTGENERWDLGWFKLQNGSKFQSLLDFDKYSNIGQNYRRTFNERNLNIQEISDRGSQEFSYQDVHLGINSQNIKEVASS